MSNLAAQLSGMLTYAKAQLGTPYVYGGDGNGGFDCSGLTQQAYKAAGISLPRTAQDQYNATNRVTAPALGDLVFFGTGPGNVTHVGIVTGNNSMIDAPHTGAQVRTENISAFGNVVGYGRPLAGVDYTDPALAGLSGASSSSGSSSGSSTSSSSSGSGGGFTGTLKRLSVETVAIGAGVGLVVLAVLRGTSAGRAVAGKVKDGAKTAAVAAAAA